MYFKLPIPAISGSKIYTACELRKPTGGTLADTKKAQNSRGVIYAMLEFMKGVIIHFEDGTGEIVKDKSKFEIICRHMPYKSAMALVIKAMAEINSTDYVRGVYTCIECQTDITVSKRNGNSIRYLDLEIEYTDNKPLQKFLQAPIQITGESGDIKAEMSSVVIGIPTINNYISGISRFNNDDNVRQEYAMMVDAIQEVDGTKPDIKWLRTWGMKIFERMDYDDLQSIYEELSRGGIQKTIKVQCPKCGELFYGDIDTSNFFASGLRRRK